MGYFSKPMLPNWISCFQSPIMHGTVCHIALSQRNPDYPETRYAWKYQIPGFQWNIGIQKKHSNIRACSSRSSSSLLPRVVSDFTVSITMIQAVINQKTILIFSNQEIYLWRYRECRSRRYVLHQATWHIRHAYDVINVCVHFCDVWRACLIIGVIQITDWVKF